MAGTDNFVKNSKRKTPYVIAEIGINHNGDIELAKEMIDAAAEANADCVSFKTSSLIGISRPCRKADYQEQMIFGQSQNEIIKSCEITVEQAEFGWLRRKKGY